jgi:hypothetical protein
MIQRNFDIRPSRARWWVRWSLTLIAAFVYVHGSAMGQGIGGESSLRPADVTATAQMIVIAASGEAEGTSWTYEDGRIVPIGGTTATIAAADVIAKLALGDLVVAGTRVSVSSSIVHTATGHALTLQATDNVIVEAGVRIELGGGDLLLWADADADRSGGILVGNDYLGLFTTALVTNGGNVTLSGGADPVSGYAHYHPDLGPAESVYNFAVGIFGASIDAGGGDVLIRGSAGDTFDGLIWTVNVGGQYGANTRVATSGTGTITIEGDGSEAPANATATNSRNSWGTVIPGTVETAAGDILLSGSGNVARTNVRGFSIAGKIQSASGAIHLDDRTPNTSSASYSGPFINGASFGRGTLPASSSNVTLQADKFAFEGTVDIATSGDVVIESVGSAFLGAGFTLPATVLTSAGSLTVGKATNTTNVTVAGTRSIDGPVTVTGDDVAFTGALTAAGDVALHATGTVTQTAPIVADGLALHGPGSYTLTDENNDVATIAAGSQASPVELLSYRDAKDGLTIGTVGALTGIEAVQYVAVETREGDLILSASVFATSNAATGVVLNAGADSDVGDATGGDVKVTDSATVNVAASAFGLLFSGGPLGSAGWETLVTSATDVYFEVDETTTLNDLDPPLVAGGIYALFREGALAVETTSATQAGRVITVAGKVLAGGRKEVLERGFVFATTPNPTTDDGKIALGTGLGAFRGSTSEWVTGTVVYVRTFARNEDGTVYGSEETITVGTYAKEVAYKFEGDTLNDVSNDDHATLVGSASYEAGASGMALCLTRTDDTNTLVNHFVRLPDGFLRERATFTVSVWFKTSSPLGSILGYQLEELGTPTNVYVPVLYVDQNGRLRGNLYADQQLSVVSSDRVDDGDWHHVAVAVGSTALTVYLDGESIGSASGAIQHFDMDFNQLGAARVTQEGLGYPDVPADVRVLGFAGCLDEFDAFDGALSRAEILAETALPAPTITSFAPMQAQVGTTLTVTGTNFSSATTVVVGGVRVTSFTIVSPTEIRVDVPEGADDGDVVVIAAGGRATAPGFVLATGEVTLASVEVTPAGPIVVSAGETFATVLVTIRDDLGAPAAGARVAFTLSDAGAAAGATLASLEALDAANGRSADVTTVTDANGRAQAQVWSTRAIPIDVAIAIGRAEGALTPAGSVTIPFVAGAVDAGTSTITVDGGPIAVGGSESATLTVTLRDAFGNPVAGANAFLAITTGAGGSLGGQPWLSDASGVITATLSGTIANVLTVTAYVGDDAEGAAIGSVQVTLVAGAPMTVIAADGDGQVASVATPVATAPRFQVLDAAGNPVPGVVVTFTASPDDALVTPLTATTDAAGFVRVASWQLGASAGVNTLTATVAGDTPVAASVTATAVAGPAAPTNLVVVLLPDGTGFVLLFDPVADATGYEFLLSPSDGAWQAQSAADAGDGAAPRTLITVTDRQPGEVLTIAVRALVDAFRGPASEEAVAILRVVTAPLGVLASVPAAPTGQRTAVRNADGSVDLSFDFEVRGSGDGILNLWIRALEVPAGYQVVTVEVPEGRGRVRLFDAYPEHWYLENAQLAGDDVVRLRVTIRWVEEE